MLQPANDASSSYGLGHLAERVMRCITRVRHADVKRGWMANIRMIIEATDRLVMLTAVADRSFDAGCAATGAHRWGRLADREEERWCLC